MPVVGLTDRPFVGRVAEREALAAHVAAAQQGRGRVMLVSGEPGVGKTRLVEEAVARVAPGRVLGGGCREIGGAPAVWPWIQVLRAYVRAPPGDRRRAELGDDAAELARLVPGIRTRCPDVAAPQGETLDAETARFRLFDAIAMFLRTIAAGGLRVLGPADLHCAHPQSLLAPA